MCVCVCVCARARARERERWSRHSEPVLKLDIQLCFPTTKRVKTIDMTVLVIFTATCCDLMGHHQVGYLLKYIELYTLAFTKLKSQFFKFCFFFNMLLFL